MKASNLFLLFLIVNIANIQSSSLDDIESLLVAEIDQGLEESMELLEKTVNINSGTMNFDGVKKVGRIFEKELLLDLSDVSFVQIDYRHNTRKDLFSVHIPLHLHYLIFTYPDLPDPQNTV